MKKQTTKFGAILAIFLRKISTYPPLRSSPSGKGRIIDVLEFETEARQDSSTRSGSLIWSAEAWLFPDPPTSS